MQVKQCSKCGEVKPLEAFSRHRHKRDGRQPYCKECEAAYRQENKERKAAYRQENKGRIAKRKAAYRQENKDRIAEYDEAYRQENKDRIAKRIAAYYQENKDRIAKRKAAYYQENKGRIAKRKAAYYQENKDHIAAYYQENKDRIAEYDAAYRQEHPEIYRASAARRRARLAELPADWTAEDESYAKDYWRGCCAVCGRPLMDLLGTHTCAMDHWIPVTADVDDNPGTVPWNMVPLCHAVKRTAVYEEACCNNSKHDKMPDEWLVEQYGKRKAKKIMDRIAAFFETTRRNTES